MAEIKKACAQHCIKYIKTYFMRDRYTLLLAFKNALDPPSFN